MSKTRLEAFSDGVIAILITVMVLEFRTPEGVTWEALRPLTPIFLTYVMSFVYLAIYWNNHHHLLHTVERVNGSVMWANMHLLFWLSLVPFITGWMGENHDAALPTATYGAVMLCASIAYWILVNVIIAQQGPHSKLHEAIGSDYKGKISILIYAVAAGVAFVQQWISDVLYVVVALMWLVPDRRIERTLERSSSL
jgi:uncharacterized membrane protein